METKAFTVCLDGYGLPTLQLLYNIGAFVILVGFGKHGRDSLHSFSLNLSSLNLSVDGLV